MDNVKSIIRTIEVSNPVFRIPWQADIFVTAVSLSHNGLYRWSDWVKAFSSVIEKYPQHEDETSEDAYYRQWLQALENMLSEKEVVSPADIGARTELWRRAYLNTPHGHPVELDAASRIYADAQAHHHHHHDDCHEHHPEARPEIKPLSVFHGAARTD